MPENRSISTRGACPEDQPRSLAACFPPPGWPRQHERRAGTTVGAGELRRVVAHDLGLEMVGAQQPLWLSARVCSYSGMARPRSPPTGRRRRGCSLRRGSGGGSSPAPAAGRRGSSPASSTKAPARPRSTGKPRSAPCTPVSCPARPGAQNPPPVGQPRRRDHRHRRQQRRTAGQSYPARLRPPPVPPLAAERHPRGCRVTERSGTNRAPSGGENTRQLNTRSCQYGEQHRPAGQRRTQRGQAGAVPPGAGLRAAPGTGRGRPPRSGSSTPGRGRPGRRT